MANIKLVTVPNKVLREKTKPVKKINGEYHKIIGDMIKLTLSFKDPEGVGLAATQVGKAEQYFILKQKDNTFKKIFNPKILRFSKTEKVFFEGCLSIPDIYGEVKRPIGVTVSYQDENGKERTEKLAGMDAWIFQHEYDHLQGKLFVDLILEQKSRLFKVVGKDKTGAEIFEEIEWQI